MSANPSNQGPVRLVCGTNEYKVSRAAQATLDELCPTEERAFGLEIIDGTADNADGAAAIIGNAASALRTVSLLGGRKTVWLKGVNFLDQSVIGKSVAVKDALPTLTDLVKNGLSQEQALLVSAGKVFRGGAFYKACKASGAIQEFDLSEYSNKADEQAEAFARQALKEAGLKLQGQAFTTFTELVGTDSRQIIQEAEKLAVYMGDQDQTVTEEDVLAIVSSAREAIRWDFSDEVGKRNLAKSIKVFRQLMFQKETPIGLIITLESHFRYLLLFRDLYDRGWLRAERGRVSWSVPAKATASFDRLPQDPRKLHPFRAGKMATQCVNFSLKELSDAFADIVDTHRRMVSGSLSGRPDLHLELLLTRIIPV